MSERMTHVDYGDVLSSIRRLVEDETRAAEPASAAIPLVLTPALRVGPEPADEAPAAPFVEVQDEEMGVVHAWPRIVPISRMAADREQAAASQSADDAAEAEAIARIFAQDAEALAIARILAEDKARHAPVQAVPEAEDARLREIVREVIREELQGAMGERVTRNIRKLVRAEINRAMMTRDLG